MKKITLNRKLNFWAIFLMLIVCSQQSFGATIEQMKTSKVTLEIVNLKISDALDALSKNSSVRIFYKSDLKDLQKRISMNFKEESLQNAVSKVLAGTSLGYEFSNDGVVITLKDKAVVNTTQQKKISIKGRIIGDDKKPITGATIIVQGTTNGAISDEKGAFSLSLNAGDMILVSFVGMKDLNRKFTENVSDLILTMEKSAVEIDEVIVTGYQQISKTRMTGSVETVTSKDIANRGYTNVSDILKGQVAGLSSMNISGRPGAAAEIRIRGINSLTGSSEPMWIVDGMPLQGDVPSISMGGTEFQETVLTSGIGNISPDDIESITVLKDAAASAIYGARAANGVIVIKTKRGTAGKSYINVQSSYFISETPKNRMKMMNTQEKIAFEKTIYEDFPEISNKGRVFNLLKNADNGVITQAAANKEIERLSGINTDWYKEIFRVAQSQNHNVSLSGGTETTQYYGSLSYLGEQGISPNNKYESLGANLKLTHDFNRNVRIYFDVISNIINDRGSAASVNPLEYATFANPYERLYDENGNYEYDRSYNNTLSSVQDGYKYDFNVMKEMNDNTSKTNSISNQINLKLEIKIINGLMLSSLGTISSRNNHTTNEIIPGSYTSKAGAWLNGVYKDDEIPNSFNNGKISESTSRSWSWTIRNQMEYARAFSDETHYVNILVGQEVSSTKNYGFSSMVPQWDPIYGLASYPNISGITMPTSSLINNFGSHSESQDRSVSFFANASYTFKDRYVGAVSARLDGADIIGTKNRFNPLWHVSAKWNIHNEPFMKNVRPINQLAFRISYGYTGSIDRNVLPFSIMVAGYSAEYDGQKIMNEYQPGSPSIKWQRKEDFNVGFDASLVNNRFNITANYYDNHTRDLIGENKIATSSGRHEIKANVASLRNYGWEFSLRTLNIKTKDFSWTTSFNIASNKNVVTDTYYDDISDLPVNAIPRPSTFENLFIKGDAVRSLYGYKYAGVDAATGETLAYVDGYRSTGERLGVPYKDGRYVYNMEQYTDEETRLAARGYLGLSYPPVSGGFSTQFNYKRFSLSANFTFMTGHLIPSFQSYSQNTAYGSERNVLKTEANRWRKVGDVTNIPKYSINQTAYVYQLFDYKYEKGNFLKCNNISMGYNLSEETCNKIRLSRVRININAANLFTATKYRGIDPETMQAFSYPSARRYNISISIGI